MFDLTSSKLLILAIVALLVVGPKDFPVLLRTIGRYMGILRKHATEFRTQFDEAIREAELDQMRDQVEQMSRDIEKSVRDADAKLASEFDEVGRDANAALAIPAEHAAAAPAPHADAPDAPAADATGPDAAAPDPGLPGAVPSEASPGQVPLPASPLPRAGALATGTPVLMTPATSPGGGETPAPAPAHAGDERSA